MDALQQVPFDLDRVIPWGRCFDEYQRMFRLGPAELAGRILGCADGPASFNAEATELGVVVVSCDPLYRLSGSQIEARVLESSAIVLAETERNKKDFVWRYFKSVQHLGHVRLAAMRRFLQDYRAGKDEGRYRDESLPALSFHDREFDLALSSHFLFLYSEQFSFQFHLRSIVEMCRIARETRIFPLIKIGGDRSQHVEPLRDQLHSSGYESEIVKVDYEFQIGGNQMLRVFSKREGCRP